ncbi:MAG TPA: NAD(P)H-dependent glycerol-3-phosphate dehydrogenase [Chitinophagales bacterium]|nr:NAD(P)H-dependent glycerol-3-phosphate dehydrogenase [Chitinophagales bacterium]
MVESKTIGVVGTGSFGVALANLIAEHHRVILYARRPEVAEQIRRTREFANQIVSDSICATNDLQEVAEKCTLIFPVVPSAFFRDITEKISPFLRPDHIMIHGTKGFNVKLKEGEKLEEMKSLSREQIQTMSELICEKTVVLRVGCLSGPNLATEIALHLPAGTVIASHFNEVIKLGRQALRSPRFQVFGSHDLIGVELAGVMKNIIAIGSGAVSGMELGENARALYITRSLGEIIRLGTALGGDAKAFLGVAGIGDIIATASSRFSRNFMVGYRLAKGDTLQQIIESSDEVAEGIHTVRITKLLADHYGVRAPILNVIYRVLFDGLSVGDAVEYLMKYQFERDVDFL